MTSPSRRQLLAAIGTASIAGCLSLGDDGNGGSSRLNEVSFANGNEEESRTIDLRVTWDGEVVHDRAYELAADEAGEDASSAVAEQTWPDEPGQFVVEARIQGMEWLELDPADVGYPDCFTVFGSIESDRNVMLLWSDDPRYCDETDDA